MFHEVRKRARKAGKPPGTAVYTGDHHLVKPTITVTHYTKDKINETTGHDIAELFPARSQEGITWIDVQGLGDLATIDKIAKLYELHPLTIEDILNVGQRSKVEEYPGYLFITLRVLLWAPHAANFASEQLSIVFGKDFVLTFQESETPLFHFIREHLHSEPGQRLRQQGCDYLIYRMIDTVVDQYFVILERLGDEIEEAEIIIISKPTPENARTIYRLKHQIMLLRKVIWPLREAISHLLQTDGNMVTSYTHLYLRDVYDHIAQAIDTFETFRDMLSGMLDLYVSSVTNRLNEIMKVLTIIATIFIPTTFIASIYGMNFDHMPELHWRWGYPMALGAMGMMMLGMLIYFRRKRWI